jgi:hypothetical protein
MAMPVTTAWPPPPEGDQNRLFGSAAGHDELITKVAVTTDQWLEPTEPDHVILVLHVTIQHRGASPTLWYWQ